MENKKGMSAIITVVIIIGIGIIMAGVIWYAINDIIENQAEDISIESTTIDMEVQKVMVETGSVKVKVKRIAGEGNLTGIKFIVSNGVDSEIFIVNSSLVELGEDTFTISYSGLVKSVEVAPIFEFKKGEIAGGRPVDKLEFSDKNIVKNIPGLVSWWKFDGNTKDEVEGNNGVLEGTTLPIYLEGKVGSDSIEFDGVDNRVDCGNDAPLDNLGDGDFSIAFWMKSGASIQNNGLMFAKVQSLFNYFSIGSDGSANRLEAKIGKSGVYLNKEWSDLTPFDQNWHYVVVVFNLTNDILRAYVDGIEGSTTGDLSSYPNDISNSGSVSWGATQGGYYDYLGSIDEVMIFNRSLSENEVKGLYNLNK
ncbi:LamG domain-containing protein [Candidatus Pacearchaeota archaeon]|nr:LamG domain-containing protein [Candidatus Pacearchaeota archaeon]